MLRLLLIISITGCLSCSKNEKTREVVEQSSKVSSKPLSIDADPDKEYIKYDSISIEAIVVSNLTIGAIREDIIQKFGRPDSVKKILNEFNGVETNAFYYSTNSFEFENNKMIGFELYDSSFYFLNEKIAVGQPFITIQKTFPISYKNRMPSGNEDEEILRIMIEGTYDYIMIKILDGTVTEIMKFENY